MITPLFLFPFLLWSASLPLDVSATRDTSNCPTPLILCPLLHPPTIGATQKEPTATGEFFVHPLSLSPPSSDAPHQQTMRGKVAFLVTWVLVWVVLAVWYAGFGDFAPLELSEGRRPMGTTPTTTATTTDKATTPTVPKAISVLGEGVQQVGGGGGSGAVSVLPLPLAPAAPTQAICAEQRAAFATEYTHALQAVNWTAAPRFGLPWRYAEGDAFCGRFLLFNKTGDVWFQISPPSPPLFLDHYQRVIEQSTQKTPPYLSTPYITISPPNTDLACLWSRAFSCFF